MAASVGATVASQVLGRTEAEKAFRPWWDKFEDQLIYGLITLGKKMMYIHYSFLCSMSSCLSVLCKLFVSFVISVFKLAQLESL